MSTFVKQSRPIAILHSTDPAPCKLAIDRNIDGMGKASLLAYLCYHELDGYPKVRKGVLFAKRTPFRAKDPIFTKRALFIISIENTDIYLKRHVYECYKKCLSNIFLVKSRI